MDPAQQERRIGILTVILALLVVVVFWMLYPHKWPFSSEGRGARPGTEAREARAKTTLENIRPLPGDEPGRIETLNFPGTNQLAVTGIYSTKSDCATLEAHYKEEFAKHGFTYAGTDESSTNESSRTKRGALSFSSRDYGATLSCTETAGSIRPYFIIMWSKAGG